MKETNDNNGYVVIHLTQTNDCEPVNYQHVFRPIFDIFGFIEKWCAS